MVVDAFERLASYEVKGAAKSIGFPKRAHEWLREIAWWLWLLMFMPYTYGLGFIIYGL
jgi:hypothetical protein